MASEEKARMQQRRATTAQWNSEDEVLKDGELGLERVSGDADRLKIGDGVTPWTSLPYLSADDYVTATNGSTLTKAAVSDGIQIALLADTRIPSQTENDALQGTSGTPSSTNRFVTDQDSRLVSVILSGLIFPYASSSIPSGYLACEGQAVSRSVYSSLFAALGTTWGSGDGSTTFNVPDLRGRTLLGSGTGAGLTARAVGDTGGEETHQLTTAELAAHSHALNHPTYTYSERNGGDTANVFAYPAGSPPNAVSSNSGSDTPHNNMQPFAVVKYIIKT